MEAIATFMPLMKQKRLELKEQMKDEKSKEI